MFHKIKINKKINTIVNLSLETFDEFDTFYDVCCDHGVLGFQLASEKPSSQIHFVDVVPSIIEKLKLKNMHYQFPNVIFDIRRGQDIKLEGQNPLVSVAGVGGDLVIDIVEELLKTMISVPT